MKPKHPHKISVTLEDIDQMGHVNNVVYVRWVQEVAETHWRTKAPEALQEQARWVVIRHEIDYLKPAMPGDELLGETWIESLEGAKSIRIVELKRGETLLAKARTTWAMVDAETGRPSRITAEMQRVFL